jgi:hypothetical protein
MLSLAGLCIVSCRMVNKFVADGGMKNVKGTEAFKENPP